MRRSTRARLFAATAALGCAGLMSLAGGAQAEELKFTFSDGRANLGDAEGVHIIDPGAGDPPATLLTSYTPGTGAFSAPPSGLNFPPKTLDNVSSPFGPLDVTATFTAISNISGNYDQATGALDTTTLNVRANIVVKDGSGANTFGECNISPVPLPLDSTGQIVDTNETPGNTADDITYAGAVFVPGPGAGVATWADLPNSTVVYEAIPGAVCSGVDSLVDGPGGIWLQGTTPTVGPDTCATVQALCPVPPPPPPNTGGGGTNPGTTPVLGTTGTKQCKKGQKLKKGKCVKKKKKKK